MAILKNLIVNGASRFLQKAYFDDIAVSGTTTISTLNATTLTASGTSRFNGRVKFNNTVGIYKTGSAYPALNFHYTNSAVTSYIQEYPAGTLNISSNLAVTSGSTTLNTLVVNNTSNFGGKVKVDGDVDIIGNLRWSTIAEHMTIQNLGGTLLVAPTIYQTTNTTITIAQDGINGNTVTFIIGMKNGTDEADAMIAPTGVTSDTTNNTFITGGANWRKLSLVKVSGKIGECVLGASDGTIESINVQNHQMTISATIANAANLEARTYSTSELSDFAVMLYKLHNGTNLFPIGIVLTSYGSDRKSYIDVYGGMNANPVARMGNLGGLTYKDYSNSDAGVDTTLANQWGFYAKGDAYFEGKLETNSGKIGGWVITSTGLKKGGALGSTNSIHLIPSGATTATSIGGSTNTNLKWTITSGNNFGVTTSGSMYCSAGKIGGWNITETQLCKGVFGDPDNASVYLIPSGSTVTANIGGYGDNITGWVITSRNTFGVNTDGGMYCTYGKIGGWTIDADSIRSGTKTSTSAGAVTLSTTNFTRTLITHGSVQNLRFAVGNRFGINQNGVLYADSVILSGDITATAGSIGNWKISDGQLSYIVNSTDTIGANGSTFLIPGGSNTTSGKATIGGSDNIGGWTITSGNNFGVTNTGALYSTSGKIGGMTIDSGGIYTGDPRNNNADTGIYFGSTDITRTIGIGTYEHIRLAIGNTFGVQRSGTVWMRSASADNITVTRAVRIKGYPADGEDTDNNRKGETFDCIRANALRVTGTGYQRTLAIGTDFQEAQVDDTYGGYTNIRPRCGITIDQYENIMYSGHKSILSINASDINLQGRYGTTPLDTAVNIKGTLQVSGRVLADSFQFDSGENRFSAVGVMNVTKDTEYTLIASHVYMLIVWYNTASGTAARGAWIFKCGQTFYMKLDTFHGVSGSAATNTATGSGVTITLTTTTMKFTTSANTSTCKLIDLG